MPRGVTPVNSQAARNQQIANAFCAGVSQRALGRQYGLSDVRIHQIVVAVLGRDRVGEITGHPQGMQYVWDESVGESRLVKSSLSRFNTGFNTGFAGARRPEEIDSDLWLTARVLCAQGQVTRVLQSTYRKIRNQNRDTVLPLAVLLQYFGSWASVRAELEARQEEILCRENRKNRRQTS